MEFIAEIGLNHGGDINLAKAMVVAAKDAGATTVKFQTYVTSERVPNDHPLFDLLTSCELSIEQFADLKNLCAEVEIEFLTTVFGLESLALARNLGLNRVKLASFSLSDEVLISQALEQGLDLVISTGVSSWGEIVRCKELLDEGGGNHVLMHCISEYPISDPKHLNLVNIEKIRELTNRPVGFSDHSMGTDAIFFAALLGAQVFEKHFTTDRSLPGPDQLMSADPQTLRDCVRQVNRATEILGNVREDSYWFEESARNFRNVTKR